MDYFLIIMIALMALMIFNNFKQIKESKRNKEYINIYKAFIKKEEGAVERLNEYLEKEKSLELKEKAKILSVYENLKLGAEPEINIDDLDLKNLILNNGKLDSNLYSLNVDSLAWVSMCMSKAHIINRNDCIESLYQKTLEIKEFVGNCVEYKTIESTYLVLLEKEDQGKTFMRKLISGNYSEYGYDKRLIGFFKQICASLLAYTGEPLEQIDEELVKDFAQTYIGREFLSNLELYERYKTEQIETQEKE